MVKNVRLNSAKSPLVISHGTRFNFYRTNREEKPFHRLIISLLSTQNKLAMRKIRVSQNPMKSSARKLQLPNWVVLQKSAPFDLVRCHPFPIKFSQILRAPSSFEFQLVKIFSSSAPKVLLPSDARQKGAKIPRIFLPKLVVYILLIYGFAWTTDCARLP